MPAFSVVQGDLQFSSIYSSPAFSLFGAISSLYEPLFQRLSKHGWRLTDFRLERGAGNLGDVHLSCYNLSLNALINVRPDRLEMTFGDLRKIGTEDMVDVAVSTIESIGRVSPNLALASHVLSLSLHGPLVGETFVDFIKEYARNPPEGMSPLIGQGVVFYFGAEGARLSSSVVLDASGSVKDGLFLKFQVAYDGQRLSVRELREAVTKDYSEMFAHFGLEPAWASV